MQNVDHNGRRSQSDLAALRELLLEAIERIRPARPITYRSDIAVMPCKALVQRIICARGEQAAAVLATKLNAELARRGKKRVVLQRVARNGNGAHVHD
jgi:hypothetical protein